MLVVHSCNAFKQSSNTIYSFYVFPEDTFNVGLTTALFFKLLGRPSLHLQSVRISKKIQKATKRIFIIRKCRKFHI